MLQIRVQTDISPPRARGKTETGRFRDKVKIRCKFVSETICLFFDAKCASCLNWQAELAKARAEAKRKAKEMKDTKKKKKVKGKKKCE